MGNIEKTLNRLFRKNEVFEVRAMGVPVNKSELWDGWVPEGGIVLGYFNNKKKAASVIRELDRMRVKIIGVTLNSINPDLLARSNNRLQSGRDIQATKNEDVLRYKFLFFDFDPNRPSGTSSTKQEKAYARQSAEKLMKHFEELEWAEPQLADSGNGYHVLYRIRLRNNERNQALVKEVLIKASEMFSDGTVKVDKSVGDPGRIIKPYGITARKGDPIKGRPHRKSKIISSPDKLKAVKRKMLVEFIKDKTKEAKARTAKGVNKKEQKTRGKGERKAKSKIFDLEGYLNDYGVGIRKVKHYDNRTLYVLNQCLFDPTHKGKDAGVGIRENGAKYYHCFHNSCESKKWKDAKRAISGKNNLNKYRPAAAIAKKTIRELNKKHAFIIQNGKPLILNEGIDPHTGQVTTTYSSIHDFKNVYTQKVPGTRQSLAEAWLESPKRRAYKGGTIFHPADDAPRGCYNLWKGFPIASKNTSCDLFLKHTRLVICGNDLKLNKWVMNWLADLVQNPAVKPGTCIVLMGKQGTGKSLWANYIGRVFGQHYMQISSPRELVGKFNSHLENKLLVFFDEATGVNNNAANGVLKAIITEDKMNIERKYVDLYPAKNYSRLIMASNDNWIINAGLEERRYCVVELSDKYMQNLKYFKKFVKEMEGEGPNGLLHHLQNMKVNKQLLRKPPATDALLNQKLASLDSVGRWWYGRLLEESVLPDHEGWEREIPTREVSQAYSEKAEYNERSTRSVQSILGKSLKRYCPGLKTKRKRNPQKGWNTQTRVYIFPSYNQCVRGFERITGCKIR